jgi:ribonuclease HI
VAGAGGVILSIGGRIQILFSWNIGQATNNWVEAYALLQGLRQERHQGIASLLILGDSKVITNHMRKKSLPWK